MNHYETGNTNEKLMNLSEPPAAKFAPCINPCCGCAGVSITVVTSAGLSKHDSVSKDYLLCSSVSIQQCMSLCEVDKPRKTRVPLCGRSCRTRPERTVAAVLYQKNSPVHTQVLCRLAAWEHSAQSPTEHSDCSRIWRLLRRPRISPRTLVPCLLCRTMVPSR